jgi:hypothetical protein
MVMSGGQVRASKLLDNIDTTLHVGGELEID